MNIEPPADHEAVRASYGAVKDNYVTMVGDPGPWLRAALDAFAEQVRNLASMVRALRPSGQLIVGTHRGYGDHPRTHGCGNVPVEWTTHLHQPEDLTALLTEAGLETVAAFGCRRNRLRKIRR